MIQTFKDLVVWQKAFALTKEIYFHTKKFPSDEKFGLVSQMQRAAVSVGSNIVEGFARNSNKQGVHFYQIANSSLEELKFQILLSYDIGYIPTPIYQNLINLSEEVSKLLRAWIKSNTKYITK